ncbi:sensor histidine kinase [Siccirubricoccus deserti]|uniref:histidine kinase n=1 Tax=Siccirubricoccus deserti TaxID=2013562 RepID=A0A9X0R2D3_9PROT|nr:MHYT domain-containing protein [Siccirubricoccus deserti]MBC4018316.1 PAS domain S-box protein [Siccirubricoccus deserti]GGC54950.1 sensor histidine kinase [Siccirubricoccus deserti]
MHSLHGTHDPTLVSLSVLIAILGSWTALDLLRRVRANSGAVRRWWLAGAAAATGASIWSMHFVAMLAYNLDVEVRYDTGTTVLSLLLAVAATAAGFAAASAKAKPGPWRIGLAGLTMGLGICLMHYVGMAAMRLAAIASYDFLLVVASGAIAVGASTLALLLALSDRSGSVRAVSAVVLGLAIAGMHYTAMFAVSFEAAPHAGHGDAPGIPVQAMALGVAACTLLLLSLALTAAMFDRRLELIASREAEALRHSGERLRAILDQMPVGVIVADATSGEIVFSNPEATRVLGHALEHTPNWRAYPASFGGVHPDGRPLAADEYPLARAVLSSERVDREPLLYRRGDKSISHLEVSATPLCDNDGRAELVIAAFQDVTARTQAEQALRRAQRLEAMGQLTGGVAHDFNNLLMVASGNLQLLARRTSDPMLLRFVRSAMEAVRRGGDVTGRLLAFAREQPLEAVPIELGVMLPDIADNVLSRTLGGTIRIQTKIEPGLWPALADAGELQAALLNLAINARDAMPDGGILTIRAENVMAEALPADMHSSLAAGDYVAVSVTDTGVGMTEDVAARAFEPFFTTKEVGHGSGLGLSQVYGFAHQSGGMATISSRPGEGTRVTVWLPRVPAIEPHRQSPSSEARVA